MKFMKIEQAPYKELVYVKPTERESICNQNFIIQVEPNPSFTTYVLQQMNCPIK
jgi:hypothetical protein